MPEVYALLCQLATISYVHIDAQRHIDVELKERRCACDVRHCIPLVSQSRDALFGVGTAFMHVNCSVKSPTHSTRVVQAAKYAISED